MDAAIPEETGDTAMDRIEHVVARCAFMTTMQATSLDHTAGCTTGMRWTMRGACVRAGWHVPTDGEWTDLETTSLHKASRVTEGTALKSTYGWYNGGNGTDDFGFSALPGGCRLTTMAASTMPGTSASGGVLRPVAAMLGSGTCAAAVQSSSGSATIHVAASRCRCLRDAE